jgi:hypothetical protein
LYLLPASQTRDKDALTEEGVQGVITELRTTFDWVICKHRKMAGDRPASTRIDQEIRSSAASRRVTYPILNWSGSLVEENRPVRHGFTRCA